jgi:hypothetical protein
LEVPHIGSPMTTEGGNMMISDIMST